MRKLIIYVWRLIRKNQRENSEKYLEEEEFNEYIKKIESRMDRIPSARKAPTWESRAQVALMFENAYTQKKITEVSNSLRNATWILAIATLIFAYTALVDSGNKGLIITDIKNVLNLFVLIIIGIVFIEIFKKLIKFIFKF